MYRHEASALHGSSTEVRRPPLSASSRRDLPATAQSLASTTDVVNGLVEHAAHSEVKLADTLRKLQQTTARLKSLKVEKQQRGWRDDAAAWHSNNHPADELPQGRWQKALDNAKVRERSRQSSHYSKRRYQQPQPFSPSQSAAGTAPSTPPHYAWPAAGGGVDSHGTLGVPTPPPRHGPHHAVPFSPVVNPQDFHRYNSMMTSAHATGGAPFATPPPPPGNVYALMAAMKQ